MVPVQGREALGEDRGKCPARDAVRLPCQQGQADARTRATPGNGCTLETNPGGHPPVGFRSHRTSHVAYIDMRE